LRTSKKKYEPDIILRTAVRLAAVCAMVLFLLIPPASPAVGQDLPDGGGPAVTQGSPQFPTSGWSAEMIGPPPPPVTGEIITTIILQPSLEAPPLFSLHTDNYQQIPVVQVKGEYFDPSGLCSTGPLSRESSKSIRARMKKSAEMGFMCFMLRVDWLAVEPESNQLNVTRLQDLLQYADDLGLKIIVSLELDRAPKWFFKGPNGPSRIMTSYLVDPELETAKGNDGDLRWSDGTGIPILYHPDTIIASKKLVYSLYGAVGKEPALLGWYLCGPVTMSFPGGGREGVIGMSDYSPFTVSSYTQLTGSIYMTYPLNRYSQRSWDNRPEFRDLQDFRLYEKREAFDELLDAFIKVDDKHMILVGMDPVLNYRNDNGYLSMVTVPDATRQLVSKGVDGAVISFKLSSKTFDALNPRSEISAMHLALTVNQVIRNNRIALVLVEKDNTDPPALNDIVHIAQMIKALGAYPIWCSGFNQRRTHHWSRPEENAIELTQPLSLLPPPKRLRRGQVAIFDLPEFYSTFYAEEEGNLSLSLTQLAIHQRTGVIVEVVSTNELTGGEPVLQQYNNIIYLAPELLTDRDAKSWFPPEAQMALYGYGLGSSGIIEAAEPMLLHQYVMENINSPVLGVLEDQLRTRYVHRGATADLLNGADAFIAANDPYVFIRVNNPRLAKYIDVKLSGWPIATMPSINMVSVGNGAALQYNITAGSAGFPLSTSQNTAGLYILLDDYRKVGVPYENRTVGVTMAQQSRNMRRSVPAALLLAALLAFTLMWMTFQSQQRSLLQAAELVERRRRIEPIDILDEPEVREFYQTYISGKDDNNATPVGKK